MQYTAKKPYDSQLIMNPNGFRYRLKAEHHFKEIRYAQLTNMKLKKDYSRLYFGFLLAPLMIVGQFFIVQDQGLIFINGLNLFFWCSVLGAVVFFRSKYTLVVEKGALSAEIFVTQDRQEAQEIKKTIESFLK